MHFHHALIMKKTGNTGSQPHLQIVLEASICRKQYLGVAAHDPAVSFVFIAYTIPAVYMDPEPDLLN